MKYGVLLTAYKGDPFNMWIWDDNGRFETDDQLEAQKLRDEYSKRNPDGHYSVQVITEEEDV